MNVVILTDELPESVLRPLPLPDLLGGGQSDRLSFVWLPDDSVMLFKRYKQESLLSDSRERLQALIRWRHELSMADRRTIDLRTSWVQHVVTDGSRLTGALVNPAPDIFWGWDGQACAPRKISTIGVREERARQRGTEFASIPRTVATVGHLLSTLTFLHRCGVVVGDLQRSNVLVSSPVAQPFTYLIDCDSVLLGGQWTLQPAEAEVMRPAPGLPWPELPEPRTVRTDLYKLALVMAASVGKDLALGGVTEEAAQCLPHGHDELLDRFLDFEQPAPGPEYLEVVARQWRDCVGADGTEFIWEPGNLRPQLWTGAASFDHVLGPGRSPVADLPKPPIPKPRPKDGTAFVPPPRPSSRPATWPPAPPVTHPDPKIPPATPKVTPPVPKAAAPVRPRRSPPTRAAPAPALVSVLTVVAVLLILAYMLWW